MDWPNRMMYRVFLEQDGEEGFSVRYGDANAWTYTNPDWMPSINEQLRLIHNRLEYRIVELDGHFLGMTHEDGSTNFNFVSHIKDEAIQRLYDLAKQEAEEVAESMTKKLGKRYVFIDITSKGDRAKAERLAEIVSKEYHSDGCVSGNPGLVADVGD